MPVVILSLVWTLLVADKDAKFTSLEDRGKFFFAVFCVWPSVFFLALFSFILVPLKRTWKALDSGIAVHTSTATQMWISWTLGLQSIAQSRPMRPMQTNKQELNELYLQTNL